MDGSADQRRACREENSDRELFLGCTDGDQIDAAGGKWLSGCGPAGQDVPIAHCPIFSRQPEPPAAKLRAPTMRLLPVLLLFAALSISAQALSIDLKPATEISTLAAA